MNEGENSSMPNNPNFSSPNITPSSAPTPNGATAEPTGQAITSSDISAMAGTNAGAVAAAAAAMPENDAPATVSSGVISSSTREPSAQRSRFGLNSRRFHDSSSTQAQQTSSFFSNTPDYFSQAANNMQVADNAAGKSKKPFIIAGAVALVAIIVVLAIIFIPRNTVAEKAVKLQELASEYAGDVVLFEDNLELASKKGFLLSAQAISDDEYKAEKDKYTNSFSRVKEFRQKLNSYSDVNIADRGTSENLNEQVEKLKKSLDIRIPVYESYSKIIPAIAHIAATKASDEAISDLESAYGSEDLKKVASLAKNYYSKRAQYDSTYNNSGCNSNRSAQACRDIVTSIMKLTSSYTKDSTLNGVMQSFLTEEMRNDNPMSYINVISNSKVKEKSNDEK